MSWFGEVAAEIDRLVVATHRAAQAQFPESELATQLRAHPGLVNAVGALLIEGPVPVESVRVIYPYLPEHIFAALIDNNVAEGVVTIDNDILTSTADGREQARLASELLDAAAASMWSGAHLDDVEATARVLVDVGRGLDPPVVPSAFAVTQALIDRPAQPGRVFRLLGALRYWRADAHRAAWTAAGLNVREAHALNRLWDLDRGAVRIGQGEELPGTAGVAGLTSKGYAADDAITERGRAARADIETDTDARTEPIYAEMDDSQRGAFLNGLRALPIS